MNNIKERLGFFLLSEKDMDKKDTEYQKFFKNMLKKYNVKSPDELEDEQKKKFFDEIDKKWKVEKEED